MFSKKQYQLFLLIVLSYWSLIPSITTFEFQSNNLILFVVLYSIGGYIRKYGFRDDLRSKDFFIVWFVMSAITVLSSGAFLLLGRKWAIFSEHYLFFYSRYNVLTIIRSVCFFMAFERMKIRNSKAINTIASACFGVYLIHDTSLMRKILWIDVFKNSTYQNSNLIILYSIGVVFLIYIGCTIIELLRIHLIENPTLRYVVRISNRIETAGRKTYQNVSKVIFGREEEK